MLNSRQEKFAQAYVLHRNATEAAKTAGYAQGSAAVQGHRLLHTDEIEERINTLEQELETNVDVINELEKQYEYAKNSLSVGCPIILPLWIKLKTFSTSTHRLDIRIVNH